MSEIKELFIAMPSCWDDEEMLITCESVLKSDLPFHDSIAECAQRGNDNRICKITIEALEGTYEELMADRQHKD